MGSRNYYFAEDPSARRAIAHGKMMDRDTRLKRLRFRSWHRGTREADLLIGGFFDAHAEGWDRAEIGLFEALIEEQDVDIMAWAIGTHTCPARYEGSVIAALKVLNYVPVET